MRERQSRSSPERHIAGFIKNPWISSLAHISDSGIWDYDGAFILGFPYTVRSFREFIDNVTLTEVPNLKCSPVRSRNIGFDEKANLDNSMALYKNQMPQPLLGKFAQQRPV